MAIKSFENFIKENIDYGGFWTDENDIKDETEIVDDLICSATDIISSNCKFNTLKIIFKKWTTEDLVSQDCFHLVCGLKGENEKLFMINRTNDFNKDAHIVGVGYILTCVINDTEYVFKIGQSRTDWIERLNSYNCGKKKYRHGKGTNSTTNYKVLQSICHIQKFHPEITFNVYLYGQDNKEDIIWKGINSGISSSDLRIPIAVEHILLALCQKVYNHIPIGNDQVNIKGSSDIFRV